MSGPDWLVYSREHNLFWRPNASGYTWDIVAAGRYTKGEAHGHCNARDLQKDTGPSEVAVAAPEIVTERDRLLVAKAALVDTLELILPLAKGYAPEGQTRSARDTCDEWVRSAMDTLARARAMT